MRFFTKQMGVILEIACMNFSVYTCNETDLLLIVSKLWSLIQQGIREPLKHILTCFNWVILVQGRNKMKGIPTERIKAKLKLPHLLYTLVRIAYVHTSDCWTFGEDFFFPFHSSLIHYIPNSVFPLSTLPSLPLHFFSPPDSLLHYFFKNMSPRDINPTRNKKLQ